MSVTKKEGVPIIEMLNIRKEFPGIVALENVSFQVYPGRIHVLMGENGAGKSTLMKILSGIHSPSSGNLVLEGKKYNRLNTHDAVRHGIAIIYQELSIINELKVYENLFVGRLPIKKILRIPVVNHAKAVNEAQKIFQQLKADIHPDTFASALSVSKQQIVEIAKVLLSSPRVLIMDEPTSSLTVSEVRVLFDIIRDLKKKQVAIIYISHKLDEIMEIGDDISILRDGVIQGSGPISDFTADEIVKRMVGRNIEDLYVRANYTADLYKSKPKLTVKNISSSDKKAVKGVSFDAYKGEVLGFYGIVGSGRTELMNCIFGADKISSGLININGQRKDIKTPMHAIKHGISLITENRRKTGFFHNFNIEKNISLPRDIKESPCYGMYGLLKKQRNITNAKKAIDLLSIKCRSESDFVTTLSGGNQQKVIVGKWINTQADIYIFDEPTRGVDVGAKLEIYTIIKELAESGKSIIIVSSDLPEILSISHRVAVFNNGQIAEILKGDEITEQNIMKSIVSTGM